MKRIPLAYLPLLLALYGCSSSKLFMYTYLMSQPGMRSKAASVSTIPYGREIKEDLDSAVEAKLVLQERELELYYKEGNLIEQHYYYPNGIPRSTMKER